MDFKEQVTTYFKNLQDEICVALETEDGKGVFEEDLWERPEGGGGRTRIIQEGNVIEKGGVNFSAVEGDLPQNIQKALGIKSQYFFATGVSIVIHPISPLVPIIHMNVRYFQTKSSKESHEVEASWFGGGIDLTPHYINKKQAAWFHQQLKVACDKHDESYYPAYKKWADDYFFIKHRNETRGIGGIFFDKLKASREINMEALFSFVKSVGNTFAPTYTHLMRINKGQTSTLQQEKWQALRRGRYVEFNLVWDKGTKFGLDTNGRTESILMSLPKNASWEYNYEVPEGSPESETLKYLKKEVDWLSYL